MSTAVSNGQTQYQVRFDWGVNGAQAIGEDADAIAWVDVLGTAAHPPAELPFVVAGLRNRQAIAE